MHCSETTTKNQNPKDNNNSLSIKIQNNIFEIIGNSKNLKYNIKNVKYNSTYIKNKNLIHILNNMKLKRDKFYKFNNNYKLDNGIKFNNFRFFLNYKLSRKYDCKINSYNVKKINELIYNIPSRFTSKFKDFLYFEENVEFLKREYHKKELNKKFKKIFDFYAKYSKTFPNYIILKEGIYMYKSILKKQEIIDEMQKLKEEEEDKAISKLMNISTETIFTMNTMESIINQKDSFWINNLNQILHLDKSLDESILIEKVNLIIKNIDELEKINKEKVNMNTIYKKEFKKIRNLSKPLYINNINPKLIKIKEKIKQIKNYRNNIGLKRKNKNNKTIESSYNSFSTTINNKSINNKGILINIKNPNNNINFYDEKKDLFKKRIPYQKVLLFKENYEKGIRKEIVNTVSNKYQQNINSKIKNVSRLSNSMITNKVKKYLDINKNYNIRNTALNNDKKSNTYNFEILFNSRKDKSKENKTDKKIFSVFCKYINNKTIPSKRSYIYKETSINHDKVNNNIKIDFLFNRNKYKSPKIYNTEIYESKTSYDIINNKSNDNKLNKNKNKKNLNISQKSFSNHTFSSLKKITKKKQFSFKKYKMKKIVNKLSLKNKIINKKYNKKKNSFFIEKGKNKDFEDKINFKIISNKRNNTKYSINNNTSTSSGNQSLTKKNKNNFLGRRIILPSGYYNRKENFINLKFLYDINAHNNKSNMKKFL